MGAYTRTGIKNKTQLYFPRRLGCKHTYAQCMHAQNETVKEGGKEGERARTKNAQTIMHKREKNHQSCYTVKVQLVQEIARPTPQHVCGLFDEARIGILQELSEVEMHGIVAGSRQGAISKEEDTRSGISSQVFAIQVHGIVANTSKRAVRRKFYASASFECTGPSVRQSKSHQYRREADDVWSCAHLVQRC